ncbi:hypothetical protein HNQ91_002600 [Filimonas zeae]|uniref:Haem-binding domain-containing protein n=1 Tax=Filimonas zeae TaxID=1737353 RepID=A0A917IUP6_9BACT|nr:heme-binding domain-containing protein [Filimonas zeae]MDR6339549.1 hypothetical protein [Filimonas zeae]GGH63102.1 hypothetical protein GCM10011379_13620 [Filimonas zeae]
MKVNILRKKRWVFAAALVVLLLASSLLIQLLQPVRNPPVTHPMQAPPEVTAVLRRACYDCHSNETRLNWLDKMAPASLLVAKDVNTARSRFNFSTWDTLSLADQQGKMWEMVNMVLNGKMPLPTYTALHPEARLTEQDIAILKKYAQDISPATLHDTTIIQQAAKELNQYRSHATPVAGKIVAANGVPFFADFQNWQVISTTNRFDNNRSIRVVYGNETAVKAIRANKINPFPEGSTIVKAVWNIVEEGNGDIIPGSFANVQIMTKDDKRFPETNGWGYAKFNGTELKPYGKTAAFAISCHNCHKAAEENGYVFNIPLPNRELK